VYAWLIDRFVFVWTRILGVLSSRYLERCCRHSLPSVRRKGRMARETDLADGLFARSGVRGALDDVDVEYGGRKGFMGVLVCTSRGEN